MSRKKTCHYNDHNDKEIHFTIFTKSKRWTKEAIKARVFLYKAIFIIMFTLFV